MSVKGSSPAVRVAAVAMAATRTAGLDPLTLMPA